MNPLLLGLGIWALFELGCANTEDPSDSPQNTAPPPSEHPERFAQNRQVLSQEPLPSDRDLGPYDYPFFIDPQSSTKSTYTNRLPLGAHPTFARGDYVIRRNLESNRCEGIPMRINALFSGEVNERRLSMAGMIPASPSSYLYTNTNIPTSTTASISILMGAFSLDYLCELSQSSLSYYPHLVARQTFELPPRNVTFIRNINSFVSPHFVFRDAEGRELIRTRRDILNPQENYAAGDQALLIPEQVIILGFFENGAYLKIDDPTNPDLATRVRYEMRPLSEVFSLFNANR